MAASELTFFYLVKDVQHFTQTCFFAADIRGRIIRLTAANNGGSRSTVSPSLG